MTQPTVNSAIAGTQEVREPVNLGNASLTPIQLPSLARLHLNQHPFVAPVNVEESSFWYEGSFDPIGAHHIEVLSRTWDLGFNRAILAIVIQNPYKPNATPYEHRRAMAAAALEDAGFKVTDNPAEEGVCLLRDQRDFHLERMNTLYGHNRYILIGPDNFQKAMVNNVLWVHPELIATNPSAPDHYGFRSMYNDIFGFRGRVLVYPHLFEAHSTALREGKDDMLPPVDRYAKEHQLYHYSGAPIKPYKGPVQADRFAKPRIKSEIELETLMKVRGKLNAGLEELNLLSEDVDYRLHAALHRLDLSQLIRVNTLLSQSALPMPDTPHPHLRRSMVEELGKLRRAIADGSLTENYLHTEGHKHVLSVLESGKKVLVIANQSGWGDLLMISQALRNEGGCAIGESLTFMAEDDLFPSDFIGTVFGSSFARMHLTEVTGDEAPIVAGMQRTLAKTRKDSLVVFPGSVEGKGSISMFGSAFVDFFKGSTDWVNLDDIVVIPCAHIGSPTLSAGQGIHVSNLKVQFGKAISTEQLGELAREFGSPAVAHFLGRKVAGMLPPEYRGIYGVPEYLEQYTKDDPTITTSDIEQIRLSLQIKL